MNLVYENPCVPLRVLLVNPTQDISIMIAMKTFRGIIFGLHQMIDLILLVYASDVGKAEEVKWNLEGSGFPCNNSITITTDIPKITDADVFVFTSNFPNPNSFEIDRVDEDDYFDSLYLLLKIARNFEMPAVPDDEKSTLQMNKPRRPIIITDGIVALDIIKNFSKNLPDDIFFCTTSISAVSRHVLCEYLKVQCNDLNYVNVWAANDNVFYVEVESPIYVLEKHAKRNRCEWELMGDETFEDLKIDRIVQLNAQWLKKEFLAKVSEITSAHPHGSLFKASKITQALQNIWKTRSLNPAPSHRCNIGVISDGSTGTIKGLPYFLPVIFTDDVFAINDSLHDDLHLKQELIKINKAALEQHKTLIWYCEKFLQKYIYQQNVKTASDESYTALTANTSSVL